MHHSITYIDKWVESFCHWCWDINVNLDEGTNLKRPHVAIAARWEIESSDQLVVGRLVVREILRGLCGKLPTVCNLSGNCTFLCPSPPSHLSDYPTTWILLYYAYSPGHPSAWLPWSLINLATWNPIALVTFHVPVEPTQQPIWCWFQNFISIWISSVKVPVVSTESRLGLIYITHCWPNSAARQPEWPKVIRQVLQAVNHHQHRQHKQTLVSATRPSMLSPGTCPARHSLLHLPPVTHPTST